MGTSLFSFTKDWSIFGRFGIQRHYAKPCSIHSHPFNTPLAMETPEHQVSFFTEFFIFFMCLCTLHFRALNS